jgi:phage recombination protein Bet
MSNPETAIAKRDYDDEQIELIKRTVAKGATNDELMLFLQICRNRRLDPFSRQVYYVKGIGVVGSIDGLRLNAERSGKYEGQEGPFWCGDDGKWVDVWLKSEPPFAAKVGAWKSGARACIWSVALWSNYNRGGPTWKKMGPHMLAKCAEALTLRKAFPEDLSGILSEEEAELAKVIEAERVDPSVGFSAASEDFGEILPISEDPQEQEVNTMTDVEHLCISYETAGTKAEVRAVAAKCSGFSGPSRDILAAAYRAAMQRVSQ